MTATWTQIIDAVAARAGLTKADARRAMAAFLEVTGETFVAGEGVRLPGLCTLQPVKRAPRVLRSIQSHRKMYVGSRWSLAVRPSKTLQAQLDAREPQHWRDAAHQQAWRLAETLLSDLEYYHRASTPSVLPADMTDERLFAACAAALGAPWHQAVKAYAEGVPDAVHAVRSYLADAVRERWCRDDP